VEVTFQFDGGHSITLPDANKEVLDVLTGDDITKGWFSITGPEGDKTAINMNSVIFFKINETKETT